MFGLDDRGIGLRFPEKLEFFPHHGVQTYSGPTLPMSTGEASEGRNVWIIFVTSGSHFVPITTLHSQMSQHHFTRSPNSHGPFRNFCLLNLSGVRLILHAHEWSMLISAITCQCGRRSNSTLTALWPLLWTQETPASTEVPLMLWTLCTVPEAEEELHL